MSGAPTEWIEGCAAAHAELLADLDSLTEAQARRQPAPGLDGGAMC